MKKLIKVSIIFILCFAIITLTPAIVYAVRNNHKYIDVDMAVRQEYINRLQGEYEFQEYTYTREQMRKALEDELDFRHYIYREGKTPRNEQGFSVALIRYIKVDISKCDIEYYCITLCHEMCHLKFFTRNEIYTQFMTFKTLYESNNAELRQVGIRFGVYVLNGSYDHEYDCSYLITDYLSKVD